MSEELPTATYVPPAVAAARRQPWWLLAVLLVVAASAGLGVGALIWAGDPEPPAASYPSGFPSLTPEQYDKCVREVSVHFDGDAPDYQMQAAVDKLRNDSRFDSAHGRTQQETYQEFKRLFADDPELVSLTRPESLPATVILTVRPGTTAKQLEKPLQEEFPGRKISVQGSCLR